MPSRNEDRTRLQNDGSWTAKAIPVNLVMHSQRKEETSSSSLGSRVNRVNDDERKRIGQAPGNWEHGNWKSEVGNCQVSRQQKVLQAARKLWQKDQTRFKSEENPPGTRKLAACTSEFRNMEYTNPSIHGKDLSVLGTEVGIVCNQRNMFNGFVQDQCIDMENCFWLCR